MVGKLVRCYCRAATAPLKRLTPLKARAGGLAVGVFLLSAACASGPSGAVQKSLNSMLAARDFDGAQTVLEKAKEKEYRKKNMVLYYLDKGVILHDAGKFKESDQSLDRAETRMEELYTKSISKGTGRYILNDNTVDYAGETFERALTNVFRALNYVFLNQPYEAVVESRKVETYLEELNRKTKGKRVFKDDAFARYLDSLLYEDIGKLDDARISMEASKKAYAWYASDYNISPPRFDFPKLDNPKMGELVFIHYNGVAPRKVPMAFYVPWVVVQAMSRAEYESPEENAAWLKNRLAASDPEDKVTISFPQYVQDAYSIRSSEVAVGPGAATQTVLMEPITAIAAKDLADRFEAIKARLIKRVTTRHTIGTILTAGQRGKSCAEEAQGDKDRYELCESRKDLFRSIGAVVEAADVRGWTTLPAEIRMARIRVPAGKHDILVRFLDRASAVVSTASFKDIAIEGKKRSYIHYRTAN